MCFCETNPPFCDGICDVNNYEQWSCDRKFRIKSVGSFWKTNPPERGFRVVFNEKWVRFAVFVGSFAAKTGRLAACPSPTLTGGTVVLRGRIRGSIG
jgi:hypothetical protein